MQLLVILPALFAGALLGCAGAGTDATQRPALHGSTTANQTARKLVAAKARLMSADYRADLKELARVRDEIAPLRDDPQLGYLASYWTGYASWRWAINSVSKGVAIDETRAHLADAIADFETSLTLREDFADSVAAAASTHSWMGTLLIADHDLATAHFTRANLLMTRAFALAPDNPRVLWVQGGFYLFKPKAYGGDPARAEEIYVRQVQTAPPLDDASPYPDWGKAEGWMSLAYAHLKRTPPALHAAAEEARAALALRPDWSYVKDVLQPQIEARMAQARHPDPPLN